MKVPNRATKLCKEHKETNKAAMKLYKEIKGREAAQREARNAKRRARIAEARHERNVHYRIWPDSAIPACSSTSTLTVSDKSVVTCLRCKKTIAFRFPANISVAS